MDPTVWLAMPVQVRRQIARWEEDSTSAGFLQADRLRQYTGEDVFALTVTDPRVPRERKRAIFCCVPHAHEPAGTAAGMDVAQQLLTGHDLLGRPSRHDVAELRRRLVVTFNPDANPGGRCWAPVLWWDGSRYSNHEFWQWMRGVDPDSGGMWQRVARWTLGEQGPLRRGIVYEQLDAETFVEPNRDPESSLVRLFRQLDARHRYDRALHLHQTEFEASNRNCMVNLPVLFDELPPSLQAANRNWAADLIAAWAALGPVIARPIAEPRSFPYGRDAQSVQWFRACWAASQQRAPELVVEVQNNSANTPPEQQLLLMGTSIWRTLEAMAGER